MIKFRLDPIVFAYMRFPEWHTSRIFSKSLTWLCNVLSNILIWLGSRSNHSLQTYKVSLTFNFANDIRDMYRSLQKLFVHTHVPLEPLKVFFIEMKKVQHPLGEKMTKSNTENRCMVVLLFLVPCFNAQSNKAKIGIQKSEMKKNSITTIKRFCDRNQPQTTFVWFEPLFYITVG